MPSPHRPSYTAQARTAQGHTAQGHTAQGFADVGFAATGFAAMGSPARLAVLRTLIKAGACLSVADIQARTGIPSTTLLHHLRALATAHLIEQRRQGRATLSTAQFENLKALADFILDQCCTDSKTELLI